MPAEMKHYRMFGGKTFYYHQTHNYGDEAQEAAERYRRKGYKVRVVMTTNSRYVSHWHLYRR